MKKLYSVDKLDGAGDQKKLLRMVQRRTFKGFYRNASISVIDDKPKSYMPNDTFDENEKKKFPRIVQHSYSQPRLMPLSKAYKVKAEIILQKKNEENLKHKIPLKTSRKNGRCLSPLARLNLSKKSIMTSPLTSVRGFPNLRQVDY